MTNGERVYRYQTGQTNDGPFLRVASAGTGSGREVSYTPRVLSGEEARAAASLTAKEAWAHEPALRAMQGELRRVGREVISPAYREVADRTGLSREMRAEARRIGLSKLLAGVWGSER